MLVYALSVWVWGKGNGGVIVEQRMAQPVMDGYGRNEHTAGFCAVGGP